MVIKSWKNRLTRVLMLLLCLASVLQAAAYSELDTIHLANGQTLHGKIRYIAGEFVEFRTTTGALSRVTRFELASRRDLVITNNNSKYLGELHYLSMFDVSMKTSQGYKEFPRLFKRKIILGIPTSYDPALIESDSQLQAPPKMFPEVKWPNEYEPPPEY